MCVAQQKDPQRQPQIVQEFFPLILFVWFCLFIERCQLDDDIVLFACVADLLSTMQFGFPVHLTCEHVGSWQRGGAH